MLTLMFPEYRFSLEATGDSKFGNDDCEEYMDERPEGVPGRRIWLSVGVGDRSERVEVGRLRRGDWGLLLLAELVTEL